MTTRVPVDDKYATQLGKAVYLFAYYEWTIICIINQIVPDFTREYCRGEKPLTSGLVLKEFKKAMNAFNKDTEQPMNQEFTTYVSTFETLINKRNALVHAHPATDTNGNQILSWQTNSKRHLHDLKWTETEIQRFIKEVDKSAVQINNFFHRIR